MVRLSEGRVVSGLVEFGLSSDEALAYVFLLRVGSCTARIVGQRLGVNRMRVYRTLRELQARGLVDITVGRPVEFVALPMEGALNDLIVKHEKDTERLRKVRSEVLEAYNSLQRVEMPSDKPRYRIVQGRQQVYDLLLKMSERSKSGVRFLTTANDLIRLGFSELDVRFRALKKHGLNVRVVTQIDPTSLQSIKEYLDLVDMRHTLLSANSRLFVVDDLEAMTTFTMDDSMSMTTQDDVGVWTNAPNYVKTMATFFDQVWEEGISAGEIVSGFTSQRMLLDGLGQATTALNVLGWMVQTPGRLMGESGFEQWFDLVARQSEGASLIVVLDMFREDEASSSILGLNIKAMDVKATLKILVGTRLWTDKEKSLAEQFGIQLLQARESQELARSIAEMLSRLLRSMNRQSQAE